MLTMIVSSAAFAAAVNSKDTAAAAEAETPVYIPVVIKYSFEAAGKAKAVVLQTPRPYTPKP